MVTHLDDHVAASPRSISALPPSFPRPLPPLKGGGSPLRTPHMRAGGPRTQVPAEDPDGVPLQRAGRRPAYPSGSRRQPKPQTARRFHMRAGGSRTPLAPKPQTACRFHMRAGGPRTQVTTGGSRSPRRRAASACGPEARVPQWQRGSSVADACGSSLSRHPRTVPQSKNLSHRPGNVDDQDGFMVR